MMCSYQAEAENDLPVLPNPPRTEGLEKALDEDQEPVRALGVAAKMGLDGAYPDAILGAEGRYPPWNPGDGRKIGRIVVDEDVDPPLVPDVDV
jgi:hypothetical protein